MCGSLRLEPWVVAYPAILARRAASSTSSFCIMGVALTLVLWRVDCAQYLQSSCKATDQRAVRGEEGDEGGRCVRERGTAAVRREGCVRERAHVGSAPGHRRRLAFGIITARVASRAQWSAPSQQAGRLERPVAAWALL